MTADDRTPLTDARLERIRASQVGVVQPDETVLFLLAEIDRLTAERDAARAALAELHRFLDQDVMPRYVELFSAAFADDPGDSVLVALVRSLLDQPASERGAELLAVVDAARAVGQACLAALRADEGPDETWAERMRVTSLSYQQALDQLWEALGIAAEVKQAYGPSHDDQWRDCRVGGRGG